MLFAPEGVFPEQVWGVPPTPPLYKAAKLVKSIENKLCGEGLKEIGLLNLEKRRLKENLIALYNHLIRVWRWELVSSP